MDGDRSARALARIEAALLRMEAAARAARAAPPAGDELDRLRRKHGKLRDAVADSLQQLDLLIDHAQG